MTDQHFDGRHAEKDLNRYKSKGPDPTTTAMLSLLRHSCLDGKSHLDIGSGIGVISLELLNNGIESSTIVDASSAYLKAARSEAESRGLQNQLTFVHGDAVEDVDQFGLADIVTLDRVLCCYPHVERLIAASTSKARTWYAASYPRDRWFVRLGVRFENGLRKLKGNPFRSFVHDPAQINDLIVSEGFERVDQAWTPTWEIALYRTS